ncbi:putative membrane protein, partial [Clostridioides difficile CD129]
MCLMLVLYIVLLFYCFFNGCMKVYYLTKFL